MRPSDRTDSHESNRLRRVLETGIPLDWIGGQSTAEHASPSKEEGAKSVRSDYFPPVLFIHRDRIHGSELAIAHETEPKGRSYRRYERNGWRGAVKFRVKLSVLMMSEERQFRASMEICDV
jgi:hypothetical protein